MSAARTLAAIALGSNLGDRLKHLRDARDKLRELSSDPDSFRQASIYQTAPVACPEGSPDFYNTVVVFDYPHPPARLLEATQTIEEKLGRERNTERNAPRIIDVDILFLGDFVESDTRLELPHPRLTSRRFVLEPLAEIAPDFVLPGQELTIAGHLTRLDASESPLTLLRSEW